MTNLPVWRLTNGWREIFARIFDGITVQFNVTPEWLVNPVTNRRLKLDMLYPEIGVAVRFEGLRGKQQRRRQSLEEEAQQRTRDDARVTICREHGIQLIVVSLGQARPPQIFRNIDLALSRAGKHVDDPVLGQKIRAARSRAASLSRQVLREANLNLYADLWEDRQYRQAEPEPDVESRAAPISYTAGMAVEHSIFGLGVVQEISPIEGDTLVTVDFVEAGQKTLAASLVKDKLLPR